MDIIQIKLKISKYWYKIFGSTETFCSQTEFLSNKSDPFLW